ncbi:YbaK/EbsC family protein [Sphingomonas abietis]|uniref:YbaK/EbsC family protein n=1 Tax=Sphingomonas abietis TaxID=3012344 RepID=A0ABY7NS91_9SPHN|nr:YbaK/EbsC family protein [Sphingomonas abietis]WBO23437.1 YbaK/EbsC family protein [Sphingomonas abietis]
MSLESVRAFLAEHAPDIAIIDQGASTATVSEAALALGVEPGQIAKTLSIRINNEVILIVARGDARLDNQKTKAVFGGRSRMLGAEEVEAVTGHPIGGVCPFGLATPLPIYCDVSLRDFAEVYPAAGSRTSSVRLTPGRLATLTDARWVGICVPPAPAPVPPITAKL